MKTLCLVRHGKAQGASETPSDFDRTLTDEGRDASKQIGARLKQRGIVPDIIVVSPAPRAVETAAIVADVLDIKPERIRWDESLYDQPDDVLFEILRSLDNTVISVMIVAHEPSLSECIMELTGLKGIKLPTCGVAGISLDIAVWSGIAPKTGTLQWLETPD